MKWKCDKCGKEIVSINQDQEDYNVSQHLEMHKRKEDGNKEKGNK
jgi:hypothetical protein